MTQSPATIYYLDTEFTALSDAGKLISLALAGTDGREFYVELVDHWCEDECSDFTREFVLPQLNLPRCGMTYEDAAAALRTFLASASEYIIACDAPKWDLMMVLPLVGPAGFPGDFHDFRILSAKELDAKLGDLPEPPHHA
jgi:hypothetical protein